MNGWVKLHRKIWENEYLRRNHTAFKLFLWCVSKADTQTHSFTTGRFQMAEETGLNPNTAYYTLKNLEKRKMLTQETNNKFTTISICNYVKYQAETNTNVNNNLTTTKQQLNNNLTLYKELRIKNINNTPPTSPIVVRERGEVELKLIKFLHSQPEIKSPEKYVDWLIKQYGSKHLEKLLTLEFSKWKEYLKYWQAQEAEHGTR